MFWVQGFEGVKALPLTVPNAEVYIRDTNDLNVMYTKSTDNMGRVTSLRGFKLEEFEIKDNSSVDTSNFVTRDELKETLEETFQKYLPQMQKQRHRDQKGGVNNETSN